MSIPQFSRLDAGESVFFARELELIKAKTYDVKQVNLKGLSLIPIDTSIDPGHEQVTYRQWNMVGIAQMISSYANDFPRADVKALEFTGNIASLGAGYGYSVQEIRAARLQGVPLDQRKANAAKRAIDVKLDTIAQTGDTGKGLLGLLNQTNAQTYTCTADGAGGLATWASKTSDQVARDMHLAVRTGVEATYELEQPDTMLLPLTSFGYIATTRMSTIDSTTILEYFLKTSPYIQEVISWYALETAGANSTKRAVIYRKDPDALEFRLPVPFESFPPEQIGMEFKVACHARCGGVVAYYPMSIGYLDGI